MYMNVHNHWLTILLLACVVDDHRLLEIAAAGTSTGALHMHMLKLCLLIIESNKLAGILGNRSGTRRFHD
jgi:hypothetical protein